MFDKAENNCSTHSYHPLKNTDADERFEYIGSIMITCHVGQYNVKKFSDSVEFCESGRPVIMLQIRKHL